MVKLNFNPVRDDILVELAPVKDNVTNGGIVLSGPRAQTRESTGIVISVGPDFELKNVKVGDKIMFMNGEFKKIEIDNDVKHDKEYAIVKSTVVIGVYN